MKDLIRETTRKVLLEFEPSTNKMYSSKWAVFDPTNSLYIVKDSNNIVSTLRTVVEYYNEANNANILFNSFLNDYASNIQKGIESLGYRLDREDFEI